MPLPALRLPDREPGLDPDTEAWCEDMIASHFASLSAATAPHCPLAPGRIEYTSSASAALDRWTRTWTAAARLPFSRAAWAHVHRCDRWADRYQPHLLDDRAFEAWCVPAESIDRTGERRELISLAQETLALHIATRDQATSPVAPLAALIARRIFPLALPDNAMLLYFDDAGGPIAHTSEHRELAFVRALAADPDDRAMREVYADHLEERGDHIGALAQRLERGDGCPDVLGTFRHARWITPLHPLRSRERRTPVPAATPPDARVELANRTLRLGRDSHLVWCDGAARVVEGGAREELYVRLFHAEDTVWLEVPPQGYAMVNANYVAGRHPLFDRDELHVLLLPRRYVRAVIRYN